jgi:hypothetical protein
MAEVQVDALKRFTANVARAELSGEGFTMPISPLVTAAGSWTARPIASTTDLPRPTNNAVMSVLR